jgi:hypothetical protein
MQTPEQRRAKLIALGHDPEKVAALPMSETGPRFYVPGKRHEPDTKGWSEEYAGERLTAAQLGVGRFHDGRGL